MDSFWWLGLGLCVIAAAFILVPLLRSGSEGERANIGLAIAIAIGIPLAAFVLYDFVGTPQASASDSSTVAVPKLKTQPQQKSQISAPPVSDLADKLARRLEASPDDPDGWALLAQSYNHLGMDAKAREAYDRAVELGYDGASLDEKIQKAAPQNATAAPTIEGELTLSDAVSEAVEDSDTVFLIARAPGGSRIPLAVQRRTAADFPLRFVLSDADVMMAGRSLAEFEQLEVSARVSKSGMADSSPDDLRAASQTVAVRGGEPVRLLIDQD